MLLAFLPALHYALEVRVLEMFLPGACVVPIINHLVCIKGIKCLKGVFCACDHMKWDQMMW